MHVTPRIQEKSHVASVHVTGQDSGAITMSRGVLAASAAVSRSLERSVASQSNPPTPDAQVSQPVDGDAKSRFGGNGLVLGGVVASPKSIPTGDEARRFGRPPAVKHGHLLCTSARSGLFPPDEFACILRQLLETGYSTKLSSQQSAPHTRSHPQVGLSVTGPATPLDEPELQKELSHCTDRSLADHERFLQIGRRLLRRLTDDQVCQHLAGDPGPSGSFSSNPEPLDEMCNLRALRSVVGRHCACTQQSEASWLGSGQGYPVEISSQRSTRVCTASKANMAIRSDKHECPALGAVTLGET